MKPVKVKAERSNATRYDVTVLVNGLPMVHVETSVVG